MDITYVTGLWNLNREGRDFQEWYIPAFKQLISIDVPFYIYGPKELEEVVWEVRDRSNTVFHLTELEDIKEYYHVHWDLTQEIRQDPNWVAQADWMKNSPQYKLEYYNPIVMSKLPWLNDVSIRNPFKSKYFYWIDAGLTRTVSAELLSNGVLNKTGNEPFLMLSYPHHHDTEIHGFEREAMAKYAGTDFVTYVCRGGFFGGNKFMLNLLNGQYYDLVRSSLRAGYMGTEESIFTILHYRNPDMIHVFNLGGGGIQPYFQHLNDKPQVKDVELYIQTYNTPKQLEALLNAMKSYDEDFLKDPKVFILDNSDDPEVEAEYADICSRWEIERIKRDNPGVTGGRKLVAEEFDKSDADLCIYFEDDMMFYEGDELDQSGFRRKIDKLYQTIVAIAKYEKFDFLKFNFEEVFAINTTNTAWHNMSKKSRDVAWPGLKGGPPFTKFNHIKSLNGVPYADGDVFYANWPHVISKEGSKKIFLENKYLSPAEWTVMAHAYELYMEGKLKAGVLLASPIQHNRLFDYDRTKRKEF